MGCKREEVTGGERVWVGSGACDALRGLNNYFEVTGGIWDVLGRVEDLKCGV